MSSLHPSPRSPFSPLVNRVLVVVGVFTFASWTLIAALLLSWAPARAAAQRTVARVAASLPGSRGPASTCTETPTVVPFEAQVTAGSDEFGYSFGDDAGDDGEGFSWSLTGGEPDANGNSRATRLRFRQDGEDYVVRDPVLVAEAQRATEPMRQTGHEMGVLGAEMGRHGAAMGRLGGQMGALGARLAALNVRLIDQSDSRASREATRAQIDELHGDLAKLRAKLSAKQSAHAGRQRELSRRMGELSARHAELSREASARVREIARRALREGKAERPHANA
jgi:hypothetical protein